MQKKFAKKKNILILAHVGDEQLIFPILPPRPDSQKRFSNGLIYTLYKSALKALP